MIDMVRTVTRSMRKKVTVQPIVPRTEQKAETTTCRSMDQLLGGGSMDQVRQVGEQVDSATRQQQEPPQQITHPGPDEMELLGGPNDMHAYYSNSAIVRSVVKESDQRPDAQP